MMEINTGITELYGVKVSFGKGDYKVSFKFQGIDIIMNLTSEEFCLLQERIKGIK